MKEKEIPEKKKMSKTTKQLFALAITMILLIGGTYAWLTLTLDDTKTNVIRAGKLELNLNETSEGIKLEKAVPMSIKKGMQQDSYSFEVINTGEKEVSYTLYLDDTNDDPENPMATETRMKDEYVKYVLAKEGDYTATIKDTAGTYTGIYDLTQNKFTSIVDSTGVEDATKLEAINNVITTSGLDADEEALGAFKSTFGETGTYEVVKNYTIGNISDLGENPNRILTTGTIKNTTDKYELRVWIDSTTGTNVMGTIFYTNLRLVAEQANKKVEETYVAYIPTYFAYGTPTTESTTDYTTLGYNAFAGLGIDNSTGVCINDGGLFCIKSNDYDNSVASMKAHFGEDNCTADESDFNCSNNNIRCRAYPNGDVACRDLLADKGCRAYPIGNFICS